MDKNRNIENYWQEFKTATGCSAETYVATSFGDSPQMASDLLALVLSGRKRATASLRRDYRQDGADLPQPDDYVIILDSKSLPRCIWRTTEVSFKPFKEVSESFAWDEGEGDRSRAFWLAAHHGYFSAQAIREGFEMYDTIETAFERFVVVWPPDAVDP